MFSLILRNGGSFTVFVPLARMPLNPNGKVDKPALPFPDTVMASRPRGATQTSQLTNTQRIINDIWLKLLPSTPSTLPLDESFFDLGGHSVLATRLIFEIRNALVVSAPLGLVFDHPTIRGLAAELDRLGGDDFALQPQAALNGVAGIPYAADADELIGQLHPSYAPPKSTTNPLRGLSHRRNRLFRRLHPTRSLASI